MHLFNQPRGYRNNNILIAIGISIVHILFFNTVFQQKKLGLLGEMVNPWAGTRIKYTIYWSTLLFLNKVNLGAADVGVGMVRMVVCKGIQGK